MNRGDRTLASALAKPLATATTYSQVQGSFWTSVHAFPRRGPGEIRTPYFLCFKQALFPVSY